MLHIEHSFNFMYRSHIQQDECRQAAVSGTVYGPHFTEKPDDCGAIVKRIKFRFDNVQDGHIVAIQLTYQLSNGQEQVGTRYGGSGGREYTMNIDVGNGERITGIIRRSGHLIQQLGFYTNKGRFYGFYGGCTCLGEYFNVWSCNLRGITGSSLGHILTSIGFYCTDI